MELARALALLCEPPAPGWPETAARVCDALDLGAAPDPAAATDTFAFQLYPYASVYLGDQGMVGGQARDRIAGFFRALGVAPPAEPDHLAVLLGALAELAEREDRGAAVARRVLVAEHLLPWLPAYLDRVGDVAPQPYPAWASLLAALLRREASVLESGALPLALRAAPAALPDPREAGRDAFLAGLLAPARAGFLLTRADLTRAARRLGLGLRIAERRYTLTALLAQDPAAVLAWLRDHARAAGRAWQGWPPHVQPVAAWWTDRAARAAALLDDLATQEAAASAASGG